MWAKVLAGLMASVSVAGVGVWVALPSGGRDGECCPVVKTAATARPSTISFCSPADDVPNDALVACAGGLAFSTGVAEPTKAGKAKCACCEE